MSSTTDGSGGSARPDANARLMEQQSEFQRAERILEIGGGDFSRVILLAERYPEKRSVSIDYRFGTASKENAGRASALPNLSILKFGLLDRILAHEVFDFAFSIAVMERPPVGSVPIRGISAVEATRRLRLFPGAVLDVQNGSPLPARRSVGHQGC